MKQKVSESELVVMEALWQSSPLSSVEVVTMLDGHGWNEKTVKTFLNRLVKKQAVSFKRDGRRYLYSPLVSRDSVLKRESRGFLDKVFQGDMKALLATFVQDKQLSVDELQYLKSLLEEASSNDSNEAGKELKGDHQ
jgi:BlaI family penicillinase repressor